MSAQHFRRRDKTGSLTGRLVDFFNANPDEELTIANIEAKFDVAHQTALNALSELVKPGGKLERVTVVRLRAKGIAGGAR